MPSETIRSPSRFGFAPAQSGTVSRCVENSSRGPGRVPGRSTIRLPVCVGSGNALMRVVEADGRGGDADFLQFVGDGGGDGRLLAGDPFHGEKPHQMVFGGLRVDGRKWCCSYWCPSCYLSFKLHPASDLLRISVQRSRSGLQPPGETEQMPDGEEQPSRRGTSR